MIARNHRRGLGRNRGQVVVRSWAVYRSRSAVRIVFRSPPVIQVRECVEIGDRRGYGPAIAQIKDNAPPLVPERRVAPRPAAQSIQGRTDCISLIDRRSWMRVWPVSAASIKLRHPIRPCFCAGGMGLGCCHLLLQGGDSVLHLGKDGQGHVAFALGELRGHPSRSSSNITRASHTRGPQAGFQS